MKKLKCEYDLFGTGLYLAEWYNIWPDSKEDRKKLYDYMCIIIDQDINSLKTGLLQWNRITDTGSIKIDPNISILEKEKQKQELKRYL